jgi:hypothetical protein
VDPQPLYIGDETMGGVSGKIDGGIIGERLCCARNEAFSVAVNRSGGM